MAINKNIKNLKPVKNTEEAKERGRLGGIAAGKARQKRKQLKELAKAILDNGIQDDSQIERIREQLPDLNKQDVTWGLALLLKQFEKAKDGDPKAFELLRDTSGQKPVEQQEIGFANTDRIEVRIDGDSVE
jgi:hypothetical protein